MSNPLPPAYTAPPPVPRNNSRGAGGNCLIASLIGCGVLVVLLVIAFATVGISFMQNPRMKKTFESISQAPNVSRATSGSMLEIRAALDGYTKDHKGAYPKTLEELVPDYMESASVLHATDSSGQPTPILYIPPASNAPGDTVVVKVHVFDMSLVANQNQHVYLALLKDGSIIQLQEGRMLMYRPGSSEPVEPSFN